MALIDVARTALTRLGPFGWAELLAEHGLDISAADLESELLRALPRIDRRLPGFEDFADEGRRGIEPGRPDRSLVLHALSSPGVVAGAGGAPLRAFPTLGEIEAVENLVFGVSPPSVEELAGRFPGAPLALAVFAFEYRPGRETVHRRHADVCFSRTGVARVGTADARYDSRSRGFVPFVEEDAHGFRVLPARYGAWIAVQLSGDEPSFGPMNFNLNQRFFGSQAPGDETRRFWVPIHKLFTGNECLRGLDLTVELEDHHVNEKLGRIHRELRRRGIDSGVEPGVLDQPPFRFSDGIAGFSPDPDLGDGVLVPMVHERFVEPADRDGQPVTFNVPPNREHGLGPSLQVAPEGEFRRAPEFVHARHLVRANGEEEDLNDDPGVVGRVRRGGYRARHYVDFTGDGWIEISCPELAVEVPHTVAAYSLVTAPDFYPNTPQRELVEWWARRVPQAIRNRVWGTPPLALSDERMTANVELAGSGFGSGDESVTAIVSMPGRGRASQRPLGRLATTRHAHLPDAAAGVFAPGWDTRKDQTRGITHLAAYGLGSPFPEDAKLCAALSAFWPAAAPDAGRSFSRSFPTATPLTDEEIGSVGDLPWDGRPGPRRTGAAGGERLEYASFDHVDYVHSALERRFSLSLTARVGVEEYLARVLAMVRAYAALGVDVDDDRGWTLVSFNAVPATDPELRAAETEAGLRLRPPRFRFLFGRRGTERPQADHRRVAVTLRDTATVFVGALPRLLTRRNAGPWRAVRPL